MTTTVPTSIRALSGVQWTDLDGITTTAAEKAAISANVSSTSKFVQNGEAMLRLLERTSPWMKKIGFADFRYLGGGVITDGYDNGQLSVTARPVFAVCVGEDAARKILADMEVGAVAMANELGQTRFVTKDYAGNIVVNGPNVDRWKLKEWGYPTDSWRIGTDNAITGGLELNVINQMAGLSLGILDQMSFSQWRAAFEKLKVASYIEASKLPAAAGGGLKTYNGKWYANGQELSYLDITFAVRVNQLFVINNTVTDYLSQLQKNNIKIKNSNAFAAIVSSVAPAGSSGNTDISKLKTQFIGAAINAGLISTPNGYFNTQAEARAHLTGANIPHLGRALFKDTDGSFWWMQKFTVNGYTNYWSYSFDQFTTDWSKVAEMFPQSITKLLELDTNKVGTFKTGTLSQNDCTTIVTELKSYTTSIESSSQVAQTQLDQYNNKRTEVLDNISNVIKGNNTALGSVAKNLGAI